MRQYLIVPSGFSPDFLPQRKLEELHLRGVNEHNADIVIIDNGIEVKRILFRKSLAQRLGAKLPKLPVRIETATGIETKILGEPEPPDLKMGMSPLIQFLIRSCGWETGLTRKELIKSVEDTEWFDEFPDFNVRTEVGANLKWLGEKHLMTYNPITHTYHSGPLRVEDFAEFSKRGYPIESGPYPVVRLIRDETSRRGRRTESQLLRTVYLDWKWTLSNDAARYWIRKCLERGYLRSPEPKVYEPHRKI